MPQYRFGVNYAGGNFREGFVVATEDVAGMFDWSGCNEKLPDCLKDPADNLCYEWHCYFDSYSGGKYNKTYEYEINRPGLCDRTPQRPRTGPTHARGRHLRIGEIIAYQTHPWFDYAAGDASAMKSRCH